MWNDAVDYREFYETPTGEMARHLIRRRLRAFWPDLHGLEVLGMGYATPYLRQFHEAARLFAFMPLTQGVMRWPGEGRNSVALVDETELPLTNFSVDRVLLVHCLENSDYLRDMLNEVWRVLKGEGRLIIVVPNRRGLWARFERTPFGYGHPYSQMQLSRLLREHSFTPLRSTQALFIPPTHSRALLRTAPAWERIGRRVSSHFAGVNIVEVSKQVYAVRPLRAAERRRLTWSLPQVVRPTPASRRY